MEKCRSSASHSLRSDQAWRTVAGKMGSHNLEERREGRRSRSERTVDSARSFVPLPGTDRCGLAGKWSDRTDYDGELVCSKRICATRVTSGKYCFHSFWWHHRGGHLEITVLKTDVCHHSDFENVLFFIHSGGII